MASRSPVPSLGRRFLFIALFVAVVPLGAIALWATQSAARSGRQLLRSQLESQLTRVVADVERRWEQYRADLLTIGESEPVRIALLDEASADLPIPDYVQLAFAQMTAFNRITIRHSSGRPLWALLDRAPGRDGVEREATGGSPGIDVVIPATDLLTGDTLGAVEASIHVADLLPSMTVLAPPSGPLTAIYLREGRPLLPPSVDERIFTDERVEWSGSRWVSVRQPTTIPGVDVVMAGPTDAFVQPFESSSRRGTAALLAVAALIVALIVMLTRRMTREVERELAHREALAAVGEFASELSHEVRNPLTAMRLDLQRIEESAHEPDTVRGITARVLRQIERMDRVVTGALRLARGGSIEPKRVDLCDVLESARRTVEPELMQRRAHASLAVDPQAELHVNGDVGALEQLFLNLLLNATQALSTGGEVRIVASRINGVVEVSIVDNGRGMTPAELSRAQRPYRSSRKDGTGLGLKIARRVVASHGGEMDVRSVAGVGTTVTVRLP
jgi:signal transduction histidine kinase